MEKDRIRKNIKQLRYMRLNAQRVVECRRQNKLFLIEYKGGKCEKCGYCKPFPSAYHFHHKKTSDKLFTISRFMSRKLDTLIKEVDKCELLCANCHAEHHDRICVSQINETIENIKKLSDEELKIRATKKKKKQIKYKCKFCSLIYVPKNKEQQYCSVKCGHLSRRKVTRPTSKNLEKLLKTKNFTQIGKMYGVSDNAVRKWISK